MNLSSISGMTNIKVKRQKFGVYQLISLIITGLVFVGFGIFSINNSKVNPTWTKINGQVVDASNNISDGTTTYTPVIQYSVNGQTYRVTSGVSSNVYPNIGEAREVAYDPARPGQSKVIEGAGIYAFLWIFTVLGIGLVILAFVLYIKSRQRSSKINNLMQVGQKVQGILTDIQTIGGNQNNNTYKIVVSATDASGTVQNYTSDSLAGIGGLAMADFRQNPIPIYVYIDPARPENYYVDVADIPNLTPERISELIKSVVNTNKPQSIVNSTQTVETPKIQPPLQ